MLPYGMSTIFQPFFRDIWRDFIRNRWKPPNRVDIRCIHHSRDLAILRWSWFDTSFSSDSGDFWGFLGLSRCMWRPQKKHNPLLLKKHSTRNHRYSSQELGAMEPWCPRYECSHPFPDEDFHKLSYVFYLSVDKLKFITYLPSDNLLHSYMAISSWFTYQTSFFP